MIIVKWLQQKTCISISRTYHDFVECFDNCFNSLRLVMMVRILNLVAFMLLSKQLQYNTSIQSLSVTKTLQSWLVDLIPNCKTRCTRDRIDTTQQLLVMSPLLYLLCHSIKKNNYFVRYIAIFYPKKWLNPHLL